MQRVSVSACRPLSLDLLQGRVGWSFRPPGGGRLKHDHAGVVGDDVVQFRCSARNLRTATDSLRRRPFELLVSWCPRFGACGYCHA